ncbi:MAG TPA: lamin tail domain-containing protein, partial [Flavobacteriales bacterium]
MGFGQATDLIISEYVEGSGNNKYIELYNGTGSAIDLSNYRLQLFANGALVGSPTNNVLLSGTLNSGATIVYRNSSAPVVAGAVSNAAMNFNGNDAIGLFKISTGSFVDLFGNIGCDPGSAWVSGALSTLDRTLVRNANICAGVTTDDPTNCPFPMLGVEWTSFATDVISNLGSHTMTCGPTVNMGSTGSTVAENVGSVTVTLPITPAATGAGTISILVTNGAEAYYPQDYSTAPAVSGNTITLNVASGATSVSFTAAVNDDGLTEGTETITFTINGTTGDLALGSALAYALNITNNDATPTYSFTTPPTGVLESAGTVTLTIGILPNAGAGGSLSVNIANGVGAAYTADYTTNPNGASGTMTIPVPVNATSVTFSVTVVDDAVIEDTEVLTFTITGAPGGAAVGTTNSTVLSIGDNDSPATTLLSGDIAIVGVNAANNTCGDDDIVSFVSFKALAPGTTIDITDNGFGLCSPGPWSDGEGILRFTRTGPTIPAGQVITFIFDTDIAANGASVAPDAQWSCVKLSTLGSLQLNNSGDQLFFLQGGTWNDPAGTNNATYTGGRVLYGFSTTGAWGGSCGSQSSGLPPSLECFSMAPTSSTSFAKYTGDISTPKTQREWLIALDDALNWTGSYANCTAYNTSAPLWNLSPTLPIIAGPMQNGLWTGAKGTDWFDCRNWDDAQVPTATSNVVIDQRSTPNCVITAPNTTTSLTADCASLTIRSNNSLGKTLVVDQGRNLVVSGNTLIERTNTLGAACGLTIQGGSSFQTNNLTIRGVTSDAQEAYFSNAFAANTVNILGHLRNENGGRLTLTNGTVRLGGDFINLNSEARFEQVGSTVLLNGAGTQNISTNGFEELFHTLRVDKTNGTVMLNNGVAIAGALELVWGRIFMNSSILTVRAGGAVTGANDNSFVHGAMRKVGNTDFVFPIGKGNRYRPAHLSTIEGDLTDGFRAEYFAASPITTFTPYAA